MIKSDTIAVSSYLTGVGYSLPDRVITNDHFTSYLETTDRWIFERTGIKERRWVNHGVTTSDLALPACIRALEDANLTSGDLDGIVVATTTPDHIFPSTACVLQKKLNARGFAFDINAVCCGFMYALTAADGLIASGVAKSILVVGADVYSVNLLNHLDRSTAFLFGDGAGAVVLQGITGLTSMGIASNPSPLEFIGQNLVKADKKTIPGIYCSKIGADGNYASILKAEMGTAFPVTKEFIDEGKHQLQMEGREVFKLAVRALADINLNVIQEAGFEVNDVDFFVMHQANVRILDAVAKQIGARSEKVLANIDRIGNTSAASIPILLGEAKESGKIKPGNLLVLSAFGGGVTWGASLVRL